jgi:hypothetical protein
LSCLDGEFKPDADSSGVKFRASTAAVRFNQLFCDSKADAGSSMLARSLFFTPVKPL